MRSILSLSRVSRLSASILGDLTRVGVSAVLFLGLARTLGPAEYGTFTGIYALASIFIPIAAIGSGHVMIRQLNVADPDDLDPWSTAISVTARGTIACFVIYICVSVALFGSKFLPTILVLGATETIITSFTELAAQRSFASRDSKFALKLRLSWGLPRFAGISFFALGVHYSIFGATADVWCLVYLVASLCGAVIGTFLAKSAFGTPSVRRLSLRSTFRGLPFTANLASAYVQDDFDKTALLRMIGAEAAGVYTVAYRLISFMVVPIQSVLNLTYSRFFNAGSVSRHAAGRLAFKVLAGLSAYSLVAAGAGFIASGLVPVIFGPSFGDSRLVFLALLGVPLFRTCQLVCGDAITGMGAQLLRTGVLAFTSVTNVLANLLLIPSLGLYGAVVATYVSEMLAAVALPICLIVLIVSRRSTTRPQIELN